MYKRRIAAVLALVLVLALLPFPALASETVITVTAAPPAAGAPASMSGIRLVNGDTGRSITLNPRLDDVAWAEVQTGAVLSQGEPFVSGRDYCLRFLASSTDYENFVTFIRGDPPVYRSDSAQCYNVSINDLGLRAGRAVIRVNLFYHTLTAYAAAGSTEGPAGVLGVVDPSPGANPVFNLTPLHPEGYTVADVIWYETAHPEKPLTDRDTFRRGVAYSLGFTLKAAGPAVVFRPDLDVLAGERRAQVTVRSEQTAAVRLDFSDGAVPVNQVAVDGLRLPTAGGVPQTKGFTTDDQGAEASFLRWDGPLDEEGRFLPGEHYTLWLTLTPLPGYVLPQTGLEAACRVNAGTIQSVRAEGTNLILAVSFATEEQHPEDLGLRTLDLTGTYCPFASPIDPEGAALETTLSLLVRDGAMVRTDGGYALAGSPGTDIAVTGTGGERTLSAAQDTHRTGRLELSPARTPADGPFFSGLVLLFPQGEGFRVSFDPSGGGGTMESVTTGPDGALVLPACTFTPPAGMTFRSWDLGAPGERVVFSADGVLSAQWREPYVNPFADVADADIILDGVLWAYHTRPQVTLGVDATHFGPNLTVTRGQTVTFLWRAMGEPEPSSGTNPFTDVSREEYWYKAVLWAVEKGITVGTDATHFTPNQTCSTAHILTFLYRTLGLGENGWFEEAGRWAEEAGLLRGLEILVHPDVPCPRGLVVTFLYRSVGQGS